MINIKTIFGVLAAVLAVVPLGVAQASASSAPIVITYEKTCTGSTCAGTTGDGDELTMRVTSGRETGNAVQLTLTESITSKAGAVLLTAAMNGHFSPAGFIVLNGTVTSGPFAGAQVHQRSNLKSGTTTEWEGELRIMPASG